jgi:hypothetical protein
MLTRRNLGGSLLWATAGVAVAGVPRSAMGGSLALPAEKPILTITGRISVTNEGDAARFDRAMLEALGTSGFETTTPWYNDPVRFEGVLMQRLLQAVGATGTSVVAYALNDYSTEIPMEDFTRYGVLLALKRNGEYMPVRDKGPLFIVYPYDSMPELKHQKYYSRSAWQVARMVVE